jgi:hypothetical protein
MEQLSTPKQMTHGEAGLAIIFAVFSFLSLFASAKALDSAFAFHAALASAVSLAAAFAIVNRYYDRPAALPPEEINGRPNYNLGPIKFAAGIAMFWGIAGFAVGLLRLSARLARAQFRPALDQLWTIASAAHFGGDLRVRRQCADRQLLLRRAEDLPCPSRRRSGAVVRGAWL